MTDTIGQMTLSELRELIENIVEQKLFELFNDSDAGLEFNEYVIERLRKQSDQVRHGDRGVYPSELGHAPNHDPNMTFDR